MNAEPSRRAALLAEKFDALRTSEYARLDAAGQVYLDYTGGGLYADSQIRQHAELLRTSVLGNPHSVNPSSLLATGLVDNARRRVLAFFNADPREFEVAFTSNASGALKLVGESFPFGPGGRLLLTVDNHNSVNGIREFARAKGADVTYVPINRPELRVDTDRLRAEINRTGGSRPKLLAFPAQSNFSGVQYDLDVIDDARRNGWSVLLDAAAFVPANRLDLDRWKPDFVALSFYKMFGYPTGVGALIVRKRALATLKRPWFAGGTISIISVQGEGWHQPLPHSAKLEDGTVDYLSLPAITIGLDFLDEIGIDDVSVHTKTMAGRLLESLIGIEHSNGQSLIHIFGPENMLDRGATIAFTMLDPKGEPYYFRHIEALAARQGISLRTGGFCNPGANETAHGLTADEMRHFFTGTDLCSFDDLYEQSREHGKYPSTVRASLGIATSLADIDALIGFASSFVDRRAAEIAAISPEWTFSETTIETP